MEIWQTVQGGDSGRGRLEDVEEGREEGGEQGRFLSMDTGLRSGLAGWLSCRICGSTLKKYNLAQLARASAPGSCAGQRCVCVAFS